MKCNIITKIIKIIKNKKLEKEKLKYFNNYFKTNYNNLNDINWRSRSLEEKLSEEFIEIFQDKIDWHYILLYQRPTSKFIREFKHKLNN